MKRLMAIALMVMALSGTCFAEPFFYFKDCDTREDYVKWGTVFTVMMFVGQSCREHNYGTDKTSYDIGTLTAGVGAIGLFAVVIKF